ncbi:hypothetical protein [Bacillus infantis]|uniref:hypothetical protein n=1 Tax=Bacillus infantis TaxID=324767 RepID=UPI003017DF13
MSLNIIAVLNPIFRENQLKTMSMEEKEFRIYKPLEEDFNGTASVRLLGIFSEI